jgi:hypothetical protein
MIIAPHYCQVTVTAVHGSEQRMIDRRSGREVASRAFVFGVSTLDFRAQRLNILNQAVIISHNTSRSVLELYLAAVNFAQLAEDGLK